MRTRPATAPVATAARRPGACSVAARGARPRCHGCDEPARTRDEAGDLSVGWLIHDPARVAALPARFHQHCRPDGIPGTLECLECGEGPLLDPALERPVDLLAAAALEAWRTENGWNTDPENPRCPRCR